MTAAHTSAGTAARPSPRTILARLDRIDTWSLPWLFIGVIGLGFLFTFYDIFDINVSFIQTCVDLKPGCTPETALASLKTPVVLNLAGYVLGTLVLSPIADRVGRRNMLMVTMAITGLGSLYNALAPDYTQFVIARIITGIGIGADLAIVNTFIGEVAPRRSRAKFTSLIFVMSALGALLGIWLGLVLTTEAAPWPKGLSFAQAGPGLRDRLALDVRGRRAAGARRDPPAPPAARVAALADRPRARRRGRGGRRRHGARGVATRPARRAGRVAARPSRRPTPRRATCPTATCCCNPMYLRRVLLLVLVWLTGYVTVYGFSAGFTSVLTAQGYAPPEAGVIVAVGAFGFLLCAVAAVLYSERLPRKVWLPISAAITVAGSVLVAAAGDTLGIAFIGSAVIFFGFNLWVPMTYARSAESFPTRARTTGFALVDGVGHLGGGIGVLLIAPAIPHMSILGALLLISSFLIVAAILASLRRGDAQPALRGGLALRERREIT